jgi:hypothetical protein
MQGGRETVNAEQMRRRIQPDAADACPANHASVVICRMTSEISDASDFRVTIDPSDLNGLRLQSQVMTDNL